MKLYLYLLSIFIGAMATLQAMQPPAKKIKINSEEVRIVQYDPAHHHTAAVRLYKTAFDDYSIIKEMHNNPNARIAILEHNNQTAALAIYCHTLVAIKKMFPEANTNTQKIKVCGLETIIVSPDQQRMGLGTKLMEHIEQEARNHTDDIITLNAVGDTSDFYEKRGFLITKFQSSTDDDADCVEMTKPLNEATDLMLQRIMDQRLKKVTQ